MEINVNNPGQFGIVQEIPAHELPMNAWSDGRNMRFANNIVEKIDGHQAAYDPPSIVPYWLMPAPAGSDYYWLYAGLTKVYAVTGASHTDITRAAGGDYTATADNVWTGGVLNGVGIVNDGSDDPQSWNPISGAQKLVLLPNWPANTKCQALRPFKNFLVALDVVKSGTRYPQMVKWSDAADPGLVPGTWDITDATKRAGEYSLAETGDYAIDCATLRDMNVIYKQNTTWGMQFVGGIPVFRFFKLFGEIGILARNCVVEYTNGQHAVFGNNDIYRHDGQTLTSLLTSRLRSYVFSRIDGTNYGRSFVVANPAKREVLFCYPLSGDSACTEAVVWNYEFNTLQIRDLPSVSSAALGIVLTNVDTATWDTDIGTWDTDTTLWSSLTFNPANRGILMSIPGATKLYKLDTTRQFAGANMTAYLERTGIVIPNKDVNVPPDITTRKLFRRVWPRITGTPGAIVKVAVGSQAYPAASPVYAAEKDYVIGTTKYLDFLVNGPLLALKYRSDSDIDWQLHGYTMDIQTLGKF
jgi:hypothetical protein